MIYKHSFKIKTHIKNVTLFHFDANSLRNITPPLIKVILLNYPVNIKNGDSIIFILKFLFLSIRWEAIIENISDYSFQDRQIVGPFKNWIHHHEFVAINENSTEVIDEITYDFDRNPKNYLIGLGMVVTLPILFRYRTWKTRKLLE